MILLKLIKASAVHVQINYFTIDAQNNNSE